MFLSSLKNLGTLSLTVVAAVMLSACASDSSKLPPDLNSLKTGPKGKFPLFEAKEKYPDFVALVPAPPAEGSYIFANDKKIFKETRKLKGTQIWKDAAQFAEVKPEVLSAYFSPVMSKPISREATPWTYYIVGRIIADVSGGGTKGIKNHYKRTRPFVYFNTGTCSTDPANQAGIIKKGADYGYFRVVCGFHWQSDVELGRIVASHVVARLHSNAEFMDALNHAKAEYRSQQK